MDFLAEIAHCAPTVHADTMRRIVQIESAFNPYAIGVVGARLQHQPRSQIEAVATIRWLDANGYNYSVGLGQVNKHNFHAHGLTAESALTACPNLRAAGAILSACFARASASYMPAQVALRAAFSCYESGNFRTGFRDGYVLKILSSSPPALSSVTAFKATKNACARPQGTAERVAEMPTNSAACSASSSTKVR